MVRFGVPPKNIDTLSYAGPRSALVPIRHARRAPTVTDTAGGIVGTEWAIEENPIGGAVEGDVYKLTNFDASGAVWKKIDFIGGISGIDLLGVDVASGAGTDPVAPNASGQVNIGGTAVAAASIPVQTASRAVNAYDIEIQVASAVTGAPADKDEVGMCCFDDTVFSVDADGYVTLVSGPGPVVDQINVDANTGPGTDPVVPSATGEITVAGAAVAAATTPVSTHSRAANAYNIEVQVASAITGAPGDTDDAGLCSFDDNYFTVDADGYVSFVGSAGYNWTEVTLTTQQMAIGNAYIANNAGLVTLTLPATAAIGDSVQIVGKGAGLFTIAQNAGQTVNIVADSTTTGVGGSLTAIEQFAALEIVCTTANTDWTVVDVSGNFTVV